MWTSGLEIISRPDVHIKIVSQQNYFPCDICKISGVVSSVEGIAVIN